MMNVSNINQTRTSAGMVLYGNNIALMKSIKSTTENLIRGHPNEHSLTSRLTVMLVTPKLMVEPGQAVVEHTFNTYKSARCWVI